MLTCYMRTKIWIVIFAADILQIYVVHVSRFWFEFNCHFLLLIRVKTHCISGFFLKNKQIKMWFLAKCICFIWGTHKVETSYKVQSPLSTYFSVVHVLKCTEWIHKVVMLKFMNQWSDKARQLSLHSHLCVLCLLWKKVYIQVLSSV